MNWQDFRRAGHWPTLLAAFLYFTVSVLVWVVLGPLSLYLGQDLGLTVGEKFAVAAIPILSGALLRVPLGMWADHVGTRRAGLLAQIIVIAGLLYAWIWGLHSRLALEIFGVVVLGASGAGFAVAMPLASRWYPPRLQGFALGVAGAGTLGVPLSSLVVPWLAQNFGWQNVFGFMLIPVVLVFVYFCWAAKDAPDRPAPVTLKSYSAVLKDVDTWWFMMFYAITFGGFVGLGSTLPLYFTQWFHVSGIAAGVMAAMVGFAGALFRPVGGMLADRFGGIRTLQYLLIVVALAYVAVALLPEGAPPIQARDATVLASGWDIGAMPGMAWLAVGIFFAGLMALGMGNGAVFQLVPLRFRNEIGVMTGLVGMAGGVGGFFLAKALGVSKVLAGSFFAGFSLFAVLAAIGLFGLLRVRTRWRTTWGAASGARV